MKRLLQFILVSYFLFFISPVAYAGYVLPYPSYMPGNKLYKVSRGMDALKQYWHWGSIASLKYHMALADKYLVEAKTLFDYQQYPLALNALARSDMHVRNLEPLAMKAQKEGKDMTVFGQTIQEAMIVHQEVLISLKDTLPEKFFWESERSESELLLLHARLMYSYELR